MSEKTLVLKSINQLLNESFYIPSYQRGYRWTDIQVKELLDDIWDFSINPPKQIDNKIKPFYCLQPIVVKSHNKTEWEVIDGQQRLTTIYLVLNNLKSQIERDENNFKKLYYETREESEFFLNNIDKNLANKNIDFFHIYQANKTIQNWFKNKANTSEFATPKAKLATTFLSDTKVIWYEIDEITEGSSSYDIFTRLNIGKIQLTNSELIKALFLRKWNDNEGIDKLRLKQLQIASEWDRIENTLQNDSFWFFIKNKEENNSDKYPNRIEYIFDLIQKKPLDAEDKYTFYKFNTEFENSRNKNEYKIPDTDEIWLKIKKYFQTFEEWFNDRELFHLIGFLITTGTPIQKLLFPEDEKGEKIDIETKIDFKSYLKELIIAKVKFNIELLQYKDEKKIRIVLLLFNIQSMLVNKESNLRFPFNLYKNENYDIEHIRSLTDKLIETVDERRSWAIDILSYLTGFDNLDEQKKLIDKKDTNEFIKPLIEIVESIKIDDFVFKQLYAKISCYFKEENEPNKCAISNLALLDASTNRGYKNAFFPIKRKTILEKDKNGTFIPIGTKNVFTKAYSNKFDEIMHWSESDASNYLNALKDILAPYLTKQDDRDNK